MSHLLSISNLNVSFVTAQKDIKAVRSVSFWLDEGEVLAIVGESGSGKSVTAKAILSLLPKKTKTLITGSILFHNTELINASERDLLQIRGNKISMVFQDSMSSLNPTMSIGKQICEGLCYHKSIPFREARQIVINTLKKLGFENPELIYKRYPHTLSGGQRQRIMIAIALVCNPQIIIADEPTTALDETLQTNILSILNNLKCHENISTILITHDLRVVSQIADRIAIMYAGQIVETGHINDIFYSPSHPYTRGLLDSLPERQKNRKQPIQGVSGMPSPPDKVNDGCPFAERCRYTMRICIHKEPIYYTSDGTHSCKCWLYDEKAPDLALPDIMKKATVHTQ